MHWLLGGYIWLFIHRPFEYYPVLGDLMLERFYVLLMLVVWAVTPNKGLAGNRLHLAIAGFVAAMAVCWLSSPWRDLCSEVVENQFKVAVFYFLFVTTVLDGAGLRRMLTAYLVAVALYMGHSLLEYVNGRIEFRMGIPRMIGVDRTFGDPNSFASTLLVSLVMALPFWDRTLAPRARPLVAAFSALASVCVLLTGSRTGFIGLCLYGLIFLLLSKSRKGVALLAAGAALLVVVALPGPLQNRFLTLVDPSVGPANAQNSAEGRLHGFEEGFEIFAQQPLLGVGPAAFGLATGKGFNPHNLYGQLASEMGLLGFVSFAAVLVCFLLNWREMRRLYREHPEWPRDLPYQVGRAAGINVLLLLFLGLAGHNLYRYAWLWFAAFQAVALHCARVRARTPAPAPVSAVGRPRPPRVRSRVLPLRPLPAGRY
jgi:O-antigen ligase